MHHLVKKRLSITRIFCLSITKIKTLWREKVVTNYPFTHLKIAINLYEFVYCHSIREIIVVMERQCSLLLLSITTIIVTESNTYFIIQGFLS